MGVKPAQSLRIPCSGGPMLSLRLCSCHLEILKKFEQEALHFHFALGPTNFVDSPVTGLYLLEGQGLSILLHFCSLTPSTPSSE